MCGMHIKFSIQFQTCQHFTNGIPITFMPGRFILILRDNLTKRALRHRNPAQLVRFVYQICYTAPNMSTLSKWYTYNFLPGRFILIFRDNPTKKIVMTQKTCTAGATCVSKFAIPLQTCQHFWLSSVL